MVRVAAFAALAAVVLDATMRSTLRVTSSDACCASFCGSRSALRNSKLMFLPLWYPASCKPARNAASQSCGLMGLPKLSESESMPMRAILGATTVFCAHTDTPSMQANAAISGVQRAVIKRGIYSPHIQSRELSSEQSDRRKHSSVWRVGKYVGWSTALR